MDIKKIIKESYNNNASLRDSSDIVDWKMDEINRLFTCLDSVQDKVLLDMGAGSGIYGKYFFDKGMDVMCIDISEKMVEMCEDKGLKSQVMDFNSLNFNNNSYDVVWSLNTLLHARKEEIEGILKEIKRVLKPDGLCYIGLYGGRDSEGIWEDDIYEPKRFFSFYSNDSILDIVSRYFDIKTFNYLPNKNRRNPGFQSMILKNSK